MFDILISTKTLFYINTSYTNVPVRNKIIPQSKFVKLSMKQKFKWKLKVKILEKNGT